MTENNSGLVLIIDDEESIRDGCTQALEKSGYTVLATGNGQEGIRIAREKRPDIAYVDLKMPCISGMDIIDILSREIPDIVLIVITGYASIISAVESMKKGAYDYLPKPFTPDQLRAVTTRGIDHRNLTLETRKLKEEKEQFEKNFITFVSHEMRSPLVTIQQYMESLKVIASGCLSGEAVNIMERCDKRIRNLEDLVEHWLDISRIENGTLTQKKEPVSLAAIVARSMDEMTPLCQRRGLKMEEEIPGDLPSVIGDEESIVRVLINIIGNATKYTPSGGMIHIGAEYDALDVTISISDTGAGIPRDKIPFIFEPFFRGKGKEDRQRGSGLGLTFCKKIMEAHDGSIEVQSKEGEGTTFLLKFPR
ncbi:MAG: hybrid sensor histidine kinase/response regulator [Thermodesulfobacteriota bacterium]|nr:hybrid sensor histidine kinase/response regulator [Thermodesulfobacteriota bacterium]